MREVYSVLRIKGDAEELSSCVDRIREGALRDEARLTRRGAVTVDLSRESDWDRHQDTVEERLEQLAPHVSGAESRGVNVHVDLAVYLTPPEGETAVVLSLIHI